MNYQSLVQRIFESRSFLCVGLDTDAAKLPAHLPPTPAGMLTFNKAIIAATLPYCVAYKINTAFYEAWGAAGWDLLAATLAEIPRTHFIIADAKRGDIGNTSSLYAKAFFETLAADAVTVAPYMGFDSVQPFLAYADKWTILLALTSNAGSHDFQQLLPDGLPLYAHVVHKAMTWAHPTQLMFVVGATHPMELAQLRQLAPDYFFLIPGVGAQGGDLQAVAQAGWNDDAGMLINASRQIIYAGTGTDFAEAAAHEAQQLQQAMSAFMATRGR